MAKPQAKFSDVPTLPSDDDIRERVYLAIAAHTTEFLKDRQVRVSRELGRHVLEGVTEVIFKVIKEHGYFRLPQGHGSLKVHRLKRDPQPKRLPTGEIVKMPANRVKVRYEEGAAVREALGMPRKTNYVRQFNRQPVLGKRANDFLKGEV